MGWVVIALAFAGIWVYALCREDRKNPEPLWMVLLAVGAGGLAFVGADLTEAILLPDVMMIEGTFQERATIAFLIAGPVEEGLKFLGILILIWPWTHFDETMDGLVYAAAAGAGFALCENLAFMQDQPEVILARGPAGTAAHVLFAVLWGGALGHAGHLPSRARKVATIVGSLALAATVHGVFNMVTFSVGREITVDQGRIVQIVLIVGCLVFLRFRIRAALALEPFRRKRRPGPAGGDQEPD